MKEKWMMASDGPWEEMKPRITTALESGFDCVVARQGDVERIRKLGDIRVASFGTERGGEDILIIGRGGEGDGSVPLPEDFGASLDISLARAAEGMVAGYVEIRGKRYEEFAVELGKSVDYLVVVGTDWKVIPLENMIAGLQGAKVKIISGVKTAEEAEVDFATLEKGADGILLDTADLSEIKRVQKLAEKAGMARLALVPAKVTAVRPVGMGDRVCVDTCTMMRPGEGMLVGSQSKAAFLVQSESEESSYVAARPFRVNAGAVHAYVKVGEKTRYLSELKAGDEVTIVDSEGGTKTAVVGRVKIEKRPLMLIEADVDGEKISTLLQNAETIKLVGKGGAPKSVTDLQPGDEVLVHFEGKARHFGMTIEESILER
ncbi:MAG TPA: 3-dehydroquinate synthase II [Methanothrix sp.]|jgi:3-dehydroquinate synthase II|nr:3-dehydroquinate synthase II [Methanothrix sp.]OPX81078.1 MAG: 3-dehydroquinate synthase [Methanosaeta sp. PtaB.Bin087]HNR57011.1 3-dehydroquinate synthase II [Methanothrix sp.]HNT71590.1 3-dehydroquinate synthase II [Methanothrix sp.]HOI69473.1 3-dehydroquinate synthase II [Methanothrix sp.]